MKVAGTAMNTQLNMASTMSVPEAPLRKPARQANAPSTHASSANGRIST